MRRFLIGLVFGASALVNACSPVYVIQAGIAEAGILSRRRPIARVIADPATPPETRHKLELVLQARDFAEHALDLNAGESYTTFSTVESDTLLLVVSGARKDRFEAHTWWFPIVGRVPYKGFFDFDDAFREAERLEASGYDASVRPSAAFSTLGWFNDPLLSTLLRYDDVSLTSTVIHELLHNTIYIPGSVAFNESFANFVGDRGAIELFCSRDGEESATCRRAQALWHDNLIFAGFLSALVAELETLYGRDNVSFEEKLAARAVIFTAARQRFIAEVEPALLTGSYGGFASRPLNNATLIGTRLYYDRLHLFEEVYQQAGGSVTAAVEAIVEAAERRPGDPWAAVETLVARKEARPGR